MSASARSTFWRMYMRARAALAAWARSSIAPRDQKLGGGGGGSGISGGIGVAASICAAQAALPVKAAPLKSAWASKLLARGNDMSVAWRSRRNGQHRRRS